MIETLPMFSEIHQERIDEMFTDIVDKIDPEKIVCYGLRTNVFHQWSSFLADVPASPISAVTVALLVSRFPWVLWYHIGTTRTMIL